MTDCNTNTTPTNQSPNVVSGGAPGISALFEICRPVDQAMVLASAVADISELGNSNTTYSDQADPYRCYEIIAALLGDTLSTMERISDDLHEHFGSQSIDSFQLSLLYTRDHFRLLATKIGQNDFNRMATASLAERLLAQLSNELKLITMPPREQAA